MRFSGAIHAATMTATALLAMLVLFPAQSAQAQERSNTASVAVTITVMPYAEITLRETQVTFVFGPGSGNQTATADVYGSFTCNVPVSISATMLEEPVDKTESSNPVRLTWGFLNVLQNVPAGPYTNVRLLTISVTRSEPWPNERYIIDLNTRQDGDGLVQITLVPQM